MPLYISPTVPHRNAATRAFQVVVIGIRMMIGIRITENSFTYRFVKSKEEKDNSPIQEVGRFE